VFLLLSIMLALSCGSSNEPPFVTAAPLVQNSNSISGHVSDDRHTPLPDLRVELLNEVDSVIQTAKTDGSGLFIFRKLSDGAFNVRVLASRIGYADQTRRVELSRPLGGFGATSEQVDFVLVPRKTTANSPQPGVVFVQEVPADAVKQYQKASDLLQKSERRQEGLTALRKAIEIYPQYFEALELLGTEHVKEQEYLAAIPVLTKALEVNVRAYPSWYALGVAQYSLKQLPDAVESFRRAVSLKEKSVNANLWFGMVLRQTSKLSEAETYLKRADVLAESKLADVHWQLALLFNQLKRFREAADQLELFLKVQPDARDAEQIRKLIQRFRQQSVSG